METVKLGIDAFGSHSNITKAIAQLITNESGGKSIALTGSWGSGKSTVVKMLQGELDSQTNLFIFDAWTHKGDPLRRTFLEQLIDFVIKKEWVNEKKWENEKCILSKKISEQTIKSTPELTNNGKIFAILTIFFLPIGLLMLSLLGTEDVPNWVPTIGAFFAFLPLIASIVVLVGYNFLFGRNDNKTEKKKKNDEILSLIINRSKTVDNSETITTPDPTSIELQQVFNKLLKDFLEENKNRKLLIVIDNLDRIDAEDALDIWATMRTFFDFNVDETEDFHSNIWLLVPFDSSALHRLWHSNGDEIINTNLVQSFIDKTFQMTFNVAPPVSSTWKDFLLDQLGVAFPDHNKDDFDDIYRLYRSCGLVENKLPTPRDLKLFINQIGALHRQWHDEIPLSVQALYVIQQRRNFDFEGGLLRDDILKPNELHLVDPDYKKYLAAIHFNVDVNESLQILMAPSIERSFLTGNDKIINELSDFPGFWQVCEHVVTENYIDWSKEECTTIFYAVSTLSSLEQIENHSFLTIRDLLLNATERVEILKIFDEKVADGFIKLIKYNQNDNFIKQIIELMSKSVPELNEGEEQLESSIVDLWLKNINIVFTELAEYNYHDTIEQNFEIDCLSSVYIEIMTQLSTSSEYIQIRPYFKIKSFLNEVIDDLTKISTEGFFNETHSKIIKTLLLNKQKWPWTDLIASLNNNIQDLNLQSSEIYASIESLLNLENNGESQASTILSDLVSQGYLLHYLHAAKDDKTKALCLVPILKTKPAGNIRPGVGSSSAGLNLYGKIISEPINYPQIIDNFAEITIQLSLIDYLIELPEKVDTVSLFISANMEAIAKRSDAYKLLPPLKLYPYLPFLEKSLSEDTLNKLLEQMVQKSSLINVLITSGFNVKISKTYLSIYKNLKYRSDENFNDLLVNGIKGIPRETWDIELKTHGDLLKLINEIVKSGIQLNLTTKFQDALLVYAEYLIKENPDLQITDIEWKNVYNALDKNSKSILLKDLIEKIIESDKAIDSILIIYGEILKECNVLVKMADHLVRHGFKKFIEMNNLNELKWLNEVLSHCPKILTACDPASKNDFKIRITEAWENELNEEAENILINIANQVGVELPTKDKEDSEDNQINEET